MKTHVNIDAISDGRTYDINDMAEAGTSGCDSCSACCHAVGGLVALTPYDVFQMTKHLGMSFDDLLEKHVTLRTDGKLKIPHLVMTGVDEACTFLDVAGRCGIHGFRPDICRLFPLGRVYEGDDFHYILLKDACIKPDLSMVNVGEWIGIPDHDTYKTFIMAWYKLLKALAFRMKFVREDAEILSISKDLMDTFYRMDSSTDDFYGAFFDLLPEAKKRLGIL